MTVPILNPQYVTEHSDWLPTFPQTVNEILSTIDDPDGNLQTVVRGIKRDPVVAARVLALANRAEVRGRRDAGITDLYTATSLIGLRRVREIALIGSLQGFAHALAGGSMVQQLWQHSVGVGVCCEELVLHTGVDVSVDSALIAGLLHDVGQAWLYAFDAQRSRDCWTRSRSGVASIDVLERESFGVDHAQIGAWLAAHWGLPAAVAQAIAGHHMPPPGGLDALVAVVHVAEVLSHALELETTQGARVPHLSKTACHLLGLNWGPETQNLFGRMEARALHTNAFFHD